MRATRQFLRRLQLPEGDAHALPASEKRFPDGAHYRIEIPSVEGPRAMTSVLEAASVDGAGAIRRFRSIVFPLLSPITFYLLVVNLIFAFFGSFGVIHAVTQGGPGRATEIMVFKVYKDGFIGLNLGSSAAQSVVLMLVVITLTALQFRFVERRVNY